jgi:hypothetical protein
MSPGNLNEVREDVRIAGSKSKVTNVRNDVRGSGQQGCKFDGPCYGVLMCRSPDIDEAKQGKLCTRNKGAADKAAGLQILFREYLVNDEIP